MELPKQFLNSSQSTQQPLWQRCAVPDKPAHSSGITQFQSIPIPLFPARQPKRMQKCRRLSMEIACRHSSRRRIRSRADAATLPSSILLLFFFPVCFRLHTSAIHPLKRRSAHGAHSLSLVEAHRRRQLQRRVLSVFIIFMLRAQERTKC